MDNPVRKWAEELERLSLAHSQLMRQIDRNERLMIAAVLIVAAAPIVVLFALRCFR